MDSEDTPAMLRKIILLVIILSSAIIFGYVLTQSGQSRPVAPKTPAVQEEGKMTLDALGFDQKLNQVQDPESAVDRVLGQPVSPKPAGPPDQPSQAVSGRQLPPPTTAIDPESAYTAILKTTRGDIVIRLKPQMTPNTVNNFIYLSKNRFYDNTIFHRIVRGFMIQGGDPKGDGTGGPGYQFADEPFEGEYKRGTVAMANSGPNTNGSQFFIMHADNPLPKQYVIFGEVVQGIEVVDKIAEAEVVTGPSGEQSHPVNPILVQTVEILNQ